MSVKEFLSSDDLDRLRRESDSEDVSKVVTEVIQLRMMISAAVMNLDHFRRNHGEQLGPDLLTEVRHIRQQLNWTLRDEERIALPLHERGLEGGDGDPEIR